MLTYAATMARGGEREISKAKADPYLRKYVDGWGNSRDDIGLVARDANERAVGAAWVRIYRHDKPYSLGASREPELSIGVMPDFRNMGVGSQLMTRLLDLCRSRFGTVILSVRETNPAVRLYERLGFQEVERIGNRVGGLSLLMRLDLENR